MIELSVLLWDSDWRSYGVNRMNSVGTLGRIIVLDELFFYWVGYLRYKKNKNRS